MATQQDAIITAQQFTSQLIQAGLKLKRAVLFGSFSTNNQTDCSDIDLALVADEFISITAADITKFSKILGKYYLIQPRTYHTNDFTTANDPFVEEILKTGIDIKI